MNKFFKISLVVFVVLLIILGFVYVKSFVIGSSNYENIVIDKVTVSSKSVIINGNYTDSIYAYKKHSYTQVGDELYVTITGVKVSNKYKEGFFSINIPVNGNEISDIHLTDGNSTKVIYSK